MVWIRKGGEPEGSFTGQGPVLGWGSFQNAFLRNGFFKKLALLDGRIPCSPEGLQFEEHGQGAFQLPVQEDLVAGEFLQSLWVEGQSVGLGHI